jgi:hypothetical protein
MNVGESSRIIAVVLCCPVLDWTVVLYQYESSDFIFCGEVDPHFGISQAYQGVAWQLFPARLVPITIRRFIDSSGSAPGADISSYVGQAKAGMDGPSAVGCCEFVPSLGNAA